MKRFSINLWSCLAVGGVLLTSVALHAEGPQRGVSTRPTAPQPPQDTFLQNVNGQLISQVEDTSETAPEPPAPEPVAESSTSQEAASNCPTCRNEGEVVYYGEPCGHGCRHGRGCKVIHQLFDWLNPHGACVKSPDYGFRPPVKQPIYRRPVAYTQWYPQQVSGQQVGYQQVSQMQQAGYRPHSVYWPTDTTQLGYYYQQVPHWHPYGGMIPGPPQPQQWHQYPTPNQGCQNGHCRIQILGTAETIAPYGSPQGNYYYQQAPSQVLPEPTQVPSELTPPQPPATEAALQPTINPGLLPLER